MTPDTSFWRGRRVLITGHTGFKGSWMSLWLQALGAEVHGVALAPPTNPSLFLDARVASGMESHSGDIRNFEFVRSVTRAISPEIVIHMAAQPLVRQSYIAPVETYATNVMGTVHLLEAARQVSSVRTIVNVTTDKCYENREWVWGYREDEPMGGYDPYSSSKGCSELITGAYRKSFLQDRGISLASARAGNVIGGGDWAAERLVPDILRAFEHDEPVLIRNPKSIRPWQHVLEPLSGYLQLAQALHNGGPEFDGAWNFGPADDDAKSVLWIVEYMASLWGGSSRWLIDDSVHPHEAHNLKLDTSKARANLGWLPRWDLATALEKVVSWQRARSRGECVREVCMEQIKEYTLQPKSIVRH
jgi:CDP-glucose 4,6-dehydratase